MNKFSTLLLAALAMVALSSVAQVQARPLEAQARRSVLPAKAAAAYPIPPTSAPSSTPAAAAHAGASAAASYLAKLSPATLAATGGIKLAASASGPGIFTFVLSAEIHGKRVVIGTAGKTVGSAGAIMVKFTLNKVGKLALRAAKRKKLKVTVVVSFKPQGGKAKTATSTATLR